MREFVNQDPANSPEDQSWRKISQPVKPRAMSRGGRWRRVLAFARVAGVVVLVGGLAGGGVLVAMSLRENSPSVPAVAKTVPVKTPELRTTRDGVLDDAWLARTLGLPPRVSLMELDLEALRARVLADGQVTSANLTRVFPDRLIVQVTERTPVARVRVEHGGLPRDLLVSRDGVIFAGQNFDPAMIDSLPWLGGLTLVPEGKGFRPVANMVVVSRLLSDAQFAAPHLYRTWQIVSVSRLELDKEIEVTTNDNTTVLFSAKGEFFVQLANLDYIMERRLKLPGTRARIDLSLGREVPVMIEPLAVSIDLKPDSAKPAVASTLSAFRSQSPSKREL